MTRKLNKRVDFVAKDADEQTATGAVLVPGELDRQGDFLRPEDIENLFNEDVDDGVMHARFPDDAAETSHRLLDEPETIGGREFAAGTWIAKREYKDDELWELVDDGILDGFSIGGDIEELNEMPNAEMPDDISVPESVSVPAQVTRLRDGVVNEVSDVDIPAVPAAVHAEKLSAAKNVVSRADTEEEFIELMGERGHDEEEARRLWAFLEETKEPDSREAKDVTNNSHGTTDAQTQKGESLGVELREAIEEAVEDAGEDTSRADIVDEITANSGGIDRSTINSIIEGRIQCPPRQRLEAFADVLPVSMDDLIAAAEEDGCEFEASKTEKELDDVDDETLGSRLKSLLIGSDDSADPAQGEGEAPGTGSAKVGRTLSKQNEDALKASIDAQLKIMENAGIETGITRFTDRTDDDFNLADFGGSEKAADGGWQKTFKLFSAEQAEIVAGLVDEFVETQGLTNVSDFEAWALEQDMRGNLSADEIVAVQSAIEDFVERRDPDLEDPVVSQFVDFVEFQREVENSKIKEVVNSDTDMTEKEDTDNGNDTSTEKDDVFEDAPEWAQKLNERIDEVEKAQGDRDETEKDDGDEEMPEWAKSLEERVDRIANSEADTDQTAKGADNGEADEADSLDVLAKALE